MTRTRILRSRDRTLGALADAAPRPNGRSGTRPRPGRRALVGSVSAGLAIGTAGVFWAFGGGNPEDRPSGAPAAASPGAGGDFCAVARDWRRALPRGLQGPASPSPTDVASYFRTNTEYLGRRAPLAPEEVAVDIELLSAAYDDLVADLEATEFSLGAAAGAPDDPELDAASTRLETFLVAECGVG